MSTLPDFNADSRTSLARQKKLQMMDYFITKTLNDYSLKSNSKDYKLGSLHGLACLAFL
jgi:hypothetical protein